MMILPGSLSEPRHYACVQLAANARRAWYRSLGSRACAWARPLTGGGPRTPGLGLHTARQGRRNRERDAHVLWQCGTAVSSDMEFCVHFRAPVSATNSDPPVAGSASDEMLWRAYVEKTRPTTCRALPSTCKAVRPFQVGTGLRFLRRQWLWQHVFFWVTDQ